MSTRTLERNGVRTSQNLLDALRHLRKDVLFFDRIAISEIGTVCNQLRAYKQDEDKQTVLEFDWLVEQGVLFDPLIDLDKEALPDTPVYRDYQRTLKGVTSLYEQIAFSTGDKGDAPHVQFTEIGPGLSLAESNLRIDAVLLGQRPGIEAIPIFPRFPTEMHSGEANTAFVMDISLKKVPIPSNDVDWAHVMALRAVPSVQESLRQLRRWIVSVAQGQLSPESIQTEATELLSDYRRVIDAECKAIELRTIRVLVATSGTFSEFVMTHRPPRKLGDVVVLGIRRLGLMESELKPPGGELAYIDDAETEPSLQSIEQAEQVALAAVTVRPGMPAPGQQLPDPRVRDKAPLQVLTPEQAEVLAADDPKPMDSKYLMEMYERITFLRPPVRDKLASRPTGADAVSPKESEIGDFQDVQERARRYLAMMPPEYQQKISLDKMVIAIREHMDSASEMFGSYPKSLKKWSIFVLPEYADVLSELTFAVFRLDELNALTVRLPSGAAAVIVNTSYASLLPAIVSAFIWIHEIGAAEPGIFSVSESEHSRFILKMAQSFGTSNYESLPELMEQAQLRTDGVEIASKAILATVLHECAHVLLGHLDRRRPGDHVQPGVCWYSLAQEHEADDFALNAVLQLDEPRRQTVLYWSLAFGILYAFQYLCLAYAKPQTEQKEHPNSAYRWLRMRPRIVKAMGGEGDVRRLEHVMQSLSTMQMFEMLKESRHGE